MRADQSTRKQREFPGSSTVTVPGSWECLGTSPEQRQHSAGPRGQQRQRHGRCGGEKAGGMGHVRGEFNQNPSQSHALHRPERTGTATKETGVQARQAEPRSLQSSAPVPSRAGPLQTSQAPTQSCEKERCLLPIRTRSPRSWGLGTSLRPKGTEETPRSCRGIFPASNS